MMLCVSASLTAILAVAPPEGDPPIQRPKTVDSAPATSPATSPQSPSSQTNPPLFFADSEPAPADPATQDPLPKDPAVEDPTVEDPVAEKPPVPATEPEIANLLGSDEPETADRRVATAPNSSERVDRSERLRSYYAATYRPKSNPGRAWFAARGAYSLTGSNQSVGGGRMVFASVEAGQTWNWLGYGLGLTVLGGSLTFGSDANSNEAAGVAKSSGILVGGGPSLGLGRLALLGRGYVDLRAGYNFFYAPVRTNLAGLADPRDAAPHGPKVQLDIGLLLHDTEARRFRHGLGATLGWQMLVHSFTGQYPRLNSFNVGVGYFFG